MRLVLGFDSTCCRCTRTAHAVAEAAPGRIEVMGLDDAPMREWCATSSRREPVLAVVGSRVRLHRGWRLPIVLAARLGPRAASRVLRALAPDPDHDTAARGGAFSRRTVLGGLTAAVGLVAGSAVAGSGRTGGAVDARLREPGSSELAGVRSGPAVRLAGNRFGTADWTRVVAATDPGDDSTVLFVPYESPGTGTAHLMTVASGSGPALVVRQVSHGAETGRVDIYDVRGVPLGGLPVGSPSGHPTDGPPDIYRGSVGGVRLASTTSGDVPAQLDKAFFICFNNCLQANGAQDAIDPCFSCITGSLQYCLECTVRAGFQAKKCYGECGGPMMAGPAPF